MPILSELNDALIEHHLSYADTRQAFLDMYFERFSDQQSEYLNRLLADAAIRGLGFNNYQNSIETGEKHFISSVLKEYRPKICIDIGANVGEYSKLLLEETESHVISFEPVPQPFMEMCTSLSAYGERFVGVNSGVGNKNKKLSINYNPDTTAFASFCPQINEIHYVVNDHILEVNVTTLDSYVEGNGIDCVDLIKIDVEGFELEVLIGARDTIDYLKPKFIQLEFNLHQLIRGGSLYAYSKLLPDYEPYQLLPGGWALRSPLDPIANIFCFSNFIFVRKS